MLALVFGIMLITLPATDPRSASSGPAVPPYDRIVTALSPSLARCAGSDKWVVLYFKPTAYVFGDGRSKAQPISFKAQGWSNQSRDVSQQQSFASAQLKKAKLAWTSFIKQFRRALVRRDRAVLKSMVASDFEGRGSIGDVDAHITVWISRRQPNLLEKPRVMDDDSPIRGWAGWGSDEAYCGIGLEYRSDGKWYIANFGCHSE